jgi:hypothetical protein
MCIRVYIYIYICIYNAHARDTHIYHAYYTHNIRAHTSATHTCTRSYTPYVLRIHTIHTHTFTQVPTYAHSQLNKKKTGAHASTLSQSPSTSGGQGIHNESLQAALGAHTLSSANQALTSDSISAAFGTHPLSVGASQSLAGGSQTLPAAHALPAPGHAPSLQSGASLLNPGPGNSASAHGLGASLYGGGLHSSLQSTGGPLVQAAQSLQQSGLLGAHKLGAGASTLPLPAPSGAHGALKSESQSLQDALASAAAGQSLTHTALTASPQLPASVLSQSLAQQPLPGPQSIAQSALGQSSLTHPSQLSQGPLAPLTQGSSLTQGPLGSLGQGSALTQGPLGSLGQGSSLTQGHLGSLGQGSPLTQGPLGSLGQGSSLTQGPLGSLGQGSQGPLGSLTQVPSFTQQLPQGSLGSGTLTPGPLSRNASFATAAALGQSATSILQTSLQSAAGLGQNGANSGGANNILTQAAVRSAAAASREWMQNLQSAAQSGAHVKEEEHWQQ